MQVVNLPPPEPPEEPSEDDEEPRSDAQEHPQADVAPAWLLDAEAQLIRADRLISAALTLIRMEASSERTSAT